MAAIPLLRDVEPLGKRRVSARRQSRVATRPELAVVEGRRRWPAFLAAVAWTVVFLGLLGAAVFHTQLAGRQLRIDRLERSVAAASPPTSSGRTTPRSSTSSPAVAGHRCSSPGHRAPARDAAATLRDQGLRVPPHARHGGGRDNDG